MRDLTRATPARIIRSMPTRTNREPAKTEAKAAATPRTARPRAAYHKGNVAEDLRSIARRLIDTEGLDPVTLRRLCREVGVTAANFYNHYPSLEFLLLDLAADGAEELNTRALRVMRRDKSKEAKLVSLAIEFVEFGIEHPDLFRIMYGQVKGSQSHERFQLAMESAFAQLVELIYEADIYRSGDIAWSHQHCAKAYAFFSFCYGTARLVSMQLFSFPSGTKAERQRFVRDLAWTFVNGLDKPIPSEG